MRGSAILGGGGLVGGLLTGLGVGTVGVVARTICGRGWVAAAVGGALLLLATMEGVGVPIPLQRGAQTNQAWLEQGTTAWALRTGIFLGTGLMSRVGFACWFGVLACGLLDAPAAIAGFAAYGLLRLVFAVRLFGPSMTWASAGGWLSANLRALHLVSAAVSGLVGIYLVHLGLTW